MIFTDVGDVPIDTIPKKKNSLKGANAKGASELPPAPAPQKNKATHGDGSTSFGVIYGNPLAHEAASAEPPIRYPLGSILVREKLAKADDAQPQLLVVMIKRARGFNPAANDWEFLTVNGTITKIKERQKRGSCLNCHASQKERDFVYPVPLND